MGQAFIVMGVSGCGKSTVGRLLARDLGAPFFDADDFHPPANVEKMRKGIPLTDEDRADWLSDLHKLLRKHVEEGKPVVLACSALRERYREVLRGKLGEAVRFIYLQGTYDLIHTRMSARKDHYMPETLLRSQFATLEEPVDALAVSIEMEAEEVVRLIIRELDQAG